MNEKEQLRKEEEQEEEERERTRTAKAMVDLKEELEISKRQSQAAAAKARAFAKAKEEAYADLHRELEAVNAKYAQKFAEVNLEDELEFDAQLEKMGIELGDTKWQ